MADTNKNIVITPNRGSLNQPNIVFTGNANVAMTLRVADDNSLSFENFSGQLFSITNNVTSGTIFSVNDISGIPFVSVNASGNVSLIPLGGANVGIGTASPRAALDVYGNVQVATGALNANGRINGANINVTGSSIPPNGLWLPTTSTLGFATAGSERIRINSTGSVGIGTSSPTSQLEVRGNIQITNAAATISGIRFSDGTFIASTNGITAGSASNVGITATTTNATFYPTFVEATSGNLGVRVDTGFTFNPSTEYLTAGAFIPSSSTATSNGMFLPAANTLGFSTNSSEKMRVDSVGNVAIGSTTTSLAKLYVNGTSSTFPLVYLNDAGNTTAALWISAQSNTAQGASIYLYGNGATTPTKHLRAKSGVFEISNHLNTTVILTLTDAGALSVPGEITAYSSDARLKDNVTVITDALEKVIMLRGVSFDWNDTAEEFGFSPEQQHDIGVIAQELELVLPEAVRPAPFDRDLQDPSKSKSGENYLTVQYEKLTALLIEAVKELNTKVTCLENEIKTMQDQK
jgi:hypothetical protein